MKVIVAGSRSIDDRVFVFRTLDRYREKITELVCGMALSWLWEKDPVAGGVDRFAYEWANDAGIPATEFHADWKKYGDGAGYRRNADMAEYADFLIAIWDGVSKGTKGMVLDMKARGKPYIVININEQGLDFE